MVVKLSPSGMRGIAAAEVVTVAKKRGKSMMEHWASVDTPPCGLISSDRQTLAEVTIHEPTL